MRRLIAIVAVASCLTVAPGSLRADPWRGAFESGFAFFVGGGTGGALAGTRFSGESVNRYGAAVPLVLRAGFDIGRYGLAVLIDTQYTFLWGPSSEQGPNPANREGHFEMLSVLGEVLWRAVGPFYLTFGAGGALTSSSQNVFDDPAGARAEVMAGLGFIYRFARKGEFQDYYPMGLTVSLESRYYVPWDERFLHFSLLAVVTFHVVLEGR